MIVATDHDGQIRELRLDRPPANAFTLELFAALREAVTRASEEGVRALVLSGRPGLYSGGLDVPVLLDLDRAGIEEMWREFYRLLHSMASSRIPIAAAITGHSAAGGAVLALFCDYRVMAEGDFKIGLNEVQVGIPMPLAILQAAARLLGPRQAERLGVSGQMVPAAEALRVGFVDELVAPDRVVDRAVEWCEGVLKLPPIAFSLTRQAARADLVRLIEAGLSQEIGRLVDNWFRDEAQTTLRAVVERIRKKKE